MAQRKQDDSTTTEVEAFVYDEPATLADRPGYTITTLPAPAPTKTRKPKEGYTRVTINLRNDNFARLQAAADSEWIAPNNFLSREVERSFDELIQIPTA